jgi:serine protease 16
VDLAKKYGALLFGVEHRFYGESINDDGLQLDSLQYLSSQQALADIAHFHQVMSAKYNLTTKNKWIAYGGSYPGSLSAWIRIKYPHLIHASIASSAPVEAKVDFNGYNDVVAQSLSQQAVGGSDKCSAAVRHAFRQIDIMIAKGLHSQLARDFVSCAPIVYELDVYMFVSNLADIFMGIVQYNNEDLGGMNISVVCDMMTLQNRSAYGSLVQLHTQYLRFTSQNCTDNSWQSFMEQMSNVTVDRGALPSMRQWIYQTCSQFGYYQTCELTSSCLFSNLMLLRPNLEICHFIFNITSDEVYAQVDFTNAYYGSNTPEGNRILFVNGLIDPWHALSVLHNLSRSELVVIIPDTAHCANMHSDRDIDPPTLRDAKQRISEQVGIWLADDKIYPAKQIARKHFNLSNDILKNLR